MKYSYVPMFERLARNPVLRHLCALVYISCIQAANTIFTSTENQTSSKRRKSCSYDPLLGFYHCMSMCPG